MRTFYYCLLILILPRWVQTQSLPNPILFCTQVPQPADFITLMSTFGNHQGSQYSAPRGGDLYIRYPDGSLKNLTQLAGYGQSGMQGATAIAVRDPHVHWDGNKALFSMVIGAPTKQYVWETYYWQIYEITGLGKNDTPVITKVPNQPANYNNVTPIYGSDDRIIFTSDCPRNGAAHLYPQHDEYESSPTVTGLWRIDPHACPGNGGLEMLTHSPSGDFTPIMDTYGRLVFTRWDHLKRDQQADADIMDNTSYGTFNYSDESASATKFSINQEIEVFPEPRAIRTDLFDLPEWANTNPQDFNIFNPWMVNEDGTGLEALNHIGRHEMAGNYFTENFTNDANLTDFYSALSSNPNPVRSMFHIRESPVTPGLYYATESPEFYTHASGMILSLYAPPSVSPEDAVFTYITHPDTRTPSNNPSANHSGLYRNPTPLSNGQILVVHTSETRSDQNIGTRANPQSRYSYRLKLLEADGSYFKASNTFLTGSGITKSISYWDPDVLVTYNGLLWETFPVEVCARPRPANPTLSTDPVPAIEAQLFENAGIDVEDFQRYLRRNNLALVVTRNVTSRDDADRQQPFNLKVAGSATQTTNPNYPGNIYEVKYLQYLQGDQLRGIGGMQNPRPGRRVIATYLHDETAMRYNMPTDGAAGSVNLAPDGSVAAFVPANRALSWQLTDANNKPIVRERIWMSAVPGEILVCTSCHGESKLNQAGLPSPTNAPQALTQLLNYIKTIDSDNDNTIDLYDFYPQNAALQAGQAVNEDFVQQLSDWVTTNGGNDAVAWSSANNIACHDEVAVINNRLVNNTGTVDKLIKTVDLTNFRTAVLNFDVAYARYNATLFDGLRVKVVSCDGQTSTTVYQKSGSALATVPDQTTPFTPTSCNQWRTECIDLSAFIGQVFELVFENVGGWGNKLYLDNIQLAEESSAEACSGALPVFLLQFQAEPIHEKEVLLSWTTAAEEALAFFEIERSKDGLQFEPIGQVKSRGTTMTGSRYQFTDVQPHLGTNYYRLRQVHIDGAIEYSHIEEVTFSTKPTFTLDVFPNPTSGNQLHIQLTNDQPVLLRLREAASGKVVWEGNQSGSPTPPINVSAIPAGMYLLQAIAENQEMRVKKVVVVK